MTDIVCYGYCCNCIARNVYHDDCYHHATDVVSNNDYCDHLTDNVCHDYRCNRVIYAVSRDDCFDYVTDNVFRDDYYDHVIDICVPVGYSHCLASCVHVIGYKEYETVWSLQICDVCYLFDVTEVARYVDHFHHYLCLLVLLADGCHV